MAVTWTMCVHCDFWQTASGQLSPALRLVLLESWKLCFFLFGVAATAHFEDESHVSQNKISNPFKKTTSGNRTPVGQKQPRHTTASCFPLPHLPSHCCGVVWCGVMWCVVFEVQCVEVLSGPVKAGHAGKQRQ